MIGEKLECYVFFTFAEGRFVMWEFILVLGCFIAGLWGAQLTSRGSIHDSPGELVFGTIVLIIAASGIFATTLNPDNATWVKSLLYVGVWGWILVAVFGLSGFIFAARGNGTTDIGSELLGVTLMVLATWSALCIVDLDYARFQQWIGSLPSYGSSATPTATATVSTPSGTATATVTPPPAPVPAPAATPPASTPPPTVSTPAPRTNLVHWKSAKPEEVRFDPIEPGKQWAIMIGDPSKPNGELVKGNVFVHSGALTSVEVYEVDVSDPKNPKPLTELGVVHPE